MSRERELLQKVRDTLRGLKETYYDLYWDIQTVLDAPEREPLGLEIMDVCGTEDYREGFKDGALYAEKCHGIGGGE